MSYHVISYHVMSCGLRKAKTMYKTGLFGHCPRVLCDRHPVLPVGLDSSPCRECVRMYCPLCKEVFLPSKSSLNGVDGCFYGTSFPQMFLMTFPSLVPKADVRHYQATVYGFNIYDPEERAEELSRNPNYAMFVQSTEGLVDPSNAPPHRRLMDTLY
ncbi:casein kinase II, regulatory subunit [Kipferlia bialata]|uniref:Casein kinase II subunit beta n=1 Tax=Kipferlia bialata TaxID=797122 RepID=A0A9K3CUE1_9EUKA|nr:casein kinase II, regulatory subunit [Kipferlia bialata]|eukprot:g3410.t1